MEQLQLTMEPANVYQMSQPFDEVREKVMQGSAKNISLQELLCCLVGKKQAEALWSVVCDFEQPLDALRNLAPEEILQIPGIGKYKAASLMAAIELGYRIFNPPPRMDKIIDDPAIAASHFSPLLAWDTVEKFAVLFLDIKHKPIKTEVVSVGAVTETIADPRVIFRKALQTGATRIIVAHNHPSGDLKPSKEDCKLLELLIRLGNDLGIPVLDSLILAHGNYLSMRGSTSLWAGAAV